MPPSDSDTKSSSVDQSAKLHGPPVQPAALSFPKKTDSETAASSSSTALPSDMATSDVDSDMDMSVSFVKETENRNDSDGIHKENRTVSVKTSAVVATQKTNISSSDKPRTGVASVQGDGVGSCSVGANRMSNVTDSPSFGEIAAGARNKVIGNLKSASRATVNDSLTYRDMSIVISSDEEDADEEDDRKDGDVVEVSEDSDDEDIPSSQRRSFDSAQRHGEVLFLTLATDTISCQSVYQSTITTTTILNLLRAHWVGG